MNLTESQQRQVEEVIKELCLSMDNCYLDIGTNYKDVVRRIPIPPDLRLKIVRQFTDNPCIAILDEDQKPPVFISVGGITEMELVNETRKSMMESGFHRIIPKG